MSDAHLQIGTCVFLNDGLRLSRAWWGRRNIHRPWPLWQPWLSFKETEVRSPDEMDHRVRLLNETVATKTSKWMPNLAKRKH